VLGTFIMTDVEKDAGFIKKQRIRIIKLINEINTIVIIENLKKDNNRYSLTFENDMNGNFIAVRITDSEDEECETLEKEDYWSLSSILNPSYFYFNKTEFQKKVTLALKEIRKMKILAQKYADLNCA